MAFIRKILSRVAVYIKVPKLVGKEVRSTKPVSVERQKKKSDGRQIDWEEFGGERKDAGIPLKLS